MGILEDRFGLRAASGALRRRRGKDAISIGSNRKNYRHILRRGDSRMNHPIQVVYLNVFDAIAHKHVHVPIRASTDIRGNRSGLSQTCDGCSSLRERDRCQA